MKQAELYSCVLGPVSTNCYFIKNKTTREVLLVDPADAPERIVSKLAEIDGTPVAILLTHGHFDHIKAVNDLKERYQIPVYACHAEELMLKEPSINMTLHYGPAVSVKPDYLLNDLDVFEAAGFRVQMIATPGHTKGSCCYYLESEGLLMSGDTLFCGSVGRTDFPGGSMREMSESLHKLLTSLPEETDVYPGHGESTTIGYEKRYNPFA